MPGLFDYTEFQIKDRLSFMQFLGLQIGDKVPDEKTKLITKCSVSGASPHNSTELENLIDETDEHLQVKMI